MSLSRTHPKYSNKNTHDWYCWNHQRSAKLDWSLGSNTPGATKRSPFRNKLFKLGFWVPIADENAGKFPTFGKRKRALVWRGTSWVTCWHVKWIQMALIYEKRCFPVIRGHVMLQGPHNVECMKRAKAAWTGTGRDNLRNHVSSLRCSAMFHLDIAQHHQKAGNSAPKSIPQNVAGRLVSARATGATTPSPYPCHSPASCGPSQWNQRCDWNSVKNCRWIGVGTQETQFNHWIIEMWILKGTKVLDPWNSSPNRNSTNNKVGIYSDRTSVEP